MRRLPRISEKMVLESAAGFYIGRLYIISEDETQPYSRESTYMPTREIAENSLLNKTYVENFLD